MKLFLKPGSCSLASHIVLEEIGRPYDTETVDLAKKLTASGADFWAIKPIRIASKRVHICHSCELNQQGQ